MLRLETAPIGSKRSRKRAAVSGLTLSAAYKGLTLPALGDRVSKKRPRRTALNRFIFLKKTGAGEGIRTLDPNLGKVVLYP